MDLIELRLLAIGGILALGIVMSALGALAAAILEWAGRVSHARAGRVPGQRAVGPRPDLGAGRPRF
jgi:hypothetical protein